MDASMSTPLCFVVEGEWGSYFLNKKRIHMTFSDAKLLVKKILIGIVVTLVPFLILFIGVSLIKNFLR
jgi:hypothetical protein